MFASKKLFGRSRSAQVRRNPRRVGRFESLEDRRMFNVDPHGGPVIPSVAIEPIFLGSQWTSEQGDGSDAHQLDQFFSFLSGSSYMDLLAQYSKPGMTIGHGSELPSMNLNVSLPGGTNITDAEIQQSLNSWIDNGSIGRPYSNELFFFFTPENVKITGPDGKIGPQQINGYHYTMNDRYGDHVRYAVIAFPMGQQGTGGFYQQAWVSSHELAEGVTDPDLNAWYNSEGEIGDLANGSDPANVVYLDNHPVQKLWSNAAGGPAAPAGATSTPVQPPISDPPPPVMQPVEITRQIPINLVPGNYTVDQQMVTYVDPSGGGSDQATINWGDGQSSPGSISFDSGSGQFVVSGDHTYAGPGTYTITVSVSNGSAAPATTSGSITLTSPRVVTPPVEITGQIPINLAPGNYTVDQQMVTFVDPSGGGNDQATINWGDGQSSPGSISFDSSSGQFVVSGQHTYAGPGTYTITVSVNNGNAAPATTSGSVTLTSPPVVAPPVVSPPVINPPVVNPPIINPPVTPPPGLTPNQQYVTAVYHAVLGTDPQPSELASWAAQLDGGLDRGSFVNALDHSASYFATIIMPAYQQYLGRAADAEGLAFWTQQMQAGLTDEQLEANFIGSPEFYQKAGGTDAAWVDALYQHLLGRAADPQGEAWWISQLANGETRSQVAIGFTAGAERERQRIQDDYFNYLGRQPSPSEVEFWLTNFEHGQTNEDLITGFLDSTEYYQRKTS